MIDTDEELEDCDSKIKDQKESINKVQEKYRSISINGQKLMKKHFGLMLLMDYEYKKI